MKRLYLLWAVAALMMTACSHGEQAADSTAGAMAVQEEEPATDSLMRLCLAETSTDPVAILEKMMNTSYCPMHGPLHHSLVGMALMTAYRNAGGEVDLGNGLTRLIKETQKIPGGACGRWGACGAALSAGTFMSIVTDNSPFATEAWHLSNLCTAKALEQVANNGGPRCCKRDSYLTILSTVDFVKEHMGVEMQRAEVRCSRSQTNEQCIGKKCPFSPANK